MYFEHQKGRKCVVHAWNNGRGFEDLHVSDLMMISNDLPYRSNLINRTGISPSLLTMWVNLYRNSHIVSRSIPIKNITILRALLSDKTIEFLIIGTTNGMGMAHSVAVKKSDSRTIVWMDSEHDGHIEITTADDFKHVLMLYRSFNIVHFVKKGKLLLDPNQSIEEVDLTD